MGDGGQDDQDNEVHVNARRVIHRAAAVVQ